MKEFHIVNIQDLLLEMSQENLTLLLQDFRSPKNFEIESFLHNKAIDFVRRKLAVTYVVLDYDGELAAYFTLAHKAIDFSAAGMSQSTKKKIERYSKFNSGSNSYSVSAFLLAQFGKNDSYVQKHSLSGNELMDFVHEVIISIQYMIGGGVLYLECEDNAFLLDFYQNKHNCFHLFGERESDSGTKYKLLYKFL